MTLFLFADLFVKILSMSGRTLLIALIGAVFGLVVGFLLANSINRNELSRLRAENDRVKDERTTDSSASSKSTLTSDEIKAAFAQADQSPTNFEIQRNVGSSMYRYAAMTKDEKLIRQSVRILERAASLRPDDYEVRLTLGNAHFDVGYFASDNESLKKARESYARTLASKPDNVDVITDVGLTYFLQTPPDYERAVGEFQRSLQKDPKHEKTLRFLVEALIKQNKSPEASQYLERLRAVNPRNESIGELTSMLASAPPAG